MAVHIYIYTQRNEREKKRGPAETRTRILGFKVLGASRYTTGPTTAEERKLNHLYYRVLSIERRQILPALIVPLDKASAFCDLQTAP